MKKGLLDEIGDRVKSYCLSDLHTIEYREKVSAAVEQFHASDYTLREWEEAVGYILGEPVQDLVSQEQAQQYLLTRLGSSELI